jgi:ATP-binding cassette subfamily F protein uup
MDFPGCLLIVSHDRYFMDRLVDHLFVFEGDGEVRDYPGNYTQYRMESAQVVRNPIEKKSEMAVPPIEIQQPFTSNTKKITYKEKREWETLEQDMERMQNEKKNLETQLQQETDFTALQAASARIGELIKELDEKEMRWLELSEKFESS